MKLSAVQIPGFGVDHDGRWGMGAHLQRLESPRRTPEGQPNFTPTCFRQDCSLPDSFGSCSVNDWILGLLRGLHRKRLLPGICEFPMFNSTSDLNVMFILSPVKIFC